ncbi:MULTISPECIES: glycosyltransferase [unclassified Microbacterium]|uniref:glycosyltransferase family 2 protein n=1 Tax=unclassified Microbacterium TaxID=2609290 RepID=UPI000EA9803B|nr:MULTISPECIES: glycosyltransferase family 2 protein [unclassified Microbacterium]MBT2485079.1 glycosyltransferase family 2 protein [Microbacterium sp. ISL-108]RKN67924.1 glycosyltransferase family 2 protein [Microbacterium sp. CGR2]
MADLTWLETVLVVFLLLCVFIGTLPVINTAWQFLMLPLHAFRNHYAEAAPYHPNVAVIIPAWNEGLVIGAAIERLLQLEYPVDRLRVFVVDDASTDDTPAVVLSKAAAHPGRVVHLRRDKGGEGKAHTLNHGLDVVLADAWTEAVLIMDADVIFARDSLRKLSRHLADEKVGAVTAYIPEASRDRNYLTRFIAIEYVIGQLSARRTQNVGGAIACLAGGAQLHSRANLEAIGGRIPTGTLAEDTMTTFEGQLKGRRMVFEPHAVVGAEEPRTIDSLWKQRLRWARGNVQLTSIYRRLWFRPSRTHNLGSVSFGLAWFTILLLPVFMVLASAAMLTLLLLHSDIAEFVFRFMWIFAACVYLYSMIYAVQLDPRIGRQSWREALMFPGLGALILMAIALFPWIFEQGLAQLGLAVTDDTRFLWAVLFYSWGPISLLGIWLARAIESLPGGRFFAGLLLYICGFGSLLCAITVDSYIKEWRRADASWIKTEKIGRVDS